MIPGEYILKEEKIVCNPDLEHITLKVINTGDRPVQIGSHYHFFEVHLIDLGGSRKSYGASNLTQGDTTSKKSLEKAMKKMKSANFKNRKS